MRVYELLEHMLDERKAALDTRDPLAIRRAGDRYKVVADAVSKLDPSTDLDPAAHYIGMREAAKALGISVREARAMARERKLPARFQGTDWKVPLAAIL